MIVLTCNASRARHRQTLHRSAQLESTNNQANSVAEFLLITSDRLFIETELAPRLIKRIHQKISEFINLDSHPCLNPNYSWTIHQLSLMSPVTQLTLNGRHRGRSQHLRAISQSDRRQMALGESLPLPQPQQPQQQQQ